MVNKIILVTILDGVVAMNATLMTVAISIGLSLTVSGAATYASRPACTAGPETLWRVIFFKFVSLSFLFYSSLVAQSLKLAIDFLNYKILKHGLLGSAIGSFMGCFFLMFSIANFIGVKLGSYSCGSEPVYVLATLFVLVGFALSVYVCTVIYASFFMKVCNNADEEMVC